MFYKTQIKSVTDYGAVDLSGRFLRFIGHLPVKAGDSVFTDGRFIFGNAPPKGAPAVFGEQSGIPILGDDDLRGYFTKYGKFRKYNVAQDDWIVNSGKKFAHSLENFDGEKVIDAYITNDGDEIVVTDGIHQVGNSLDSAFLLLHLSSNRSFRNSDWAEGVIALTGELHSMKQVLGSDSFPLNHKDVKMFVNGI